MTKSLKDIHELLSRNSLRQAWLDIEAALAEVQAEMKIIPEEAAREIRSKAHLKFFNIHELNQDIERTKAPIASLTKMLAAACEEGYGGFVHWGATTQNIMQTGRILQIKKVHTQMKWEFGLLLSALANLADQGRDMIMAGRTQRRQALPITFGFKVAGWIDEFLRHLERFDQFEPRFFCLQFGGAIGAMQSFGKQGPEIGERLGKLLDLSVLSVPVRSAGDYLAEYVSVMALYATTCSKIAQEIYTLMADEMGEVSEGQGEGVISSSTMPLKVNSKVACNIMAVAARIRSQLSLAMEGMQPSHDGDAANNKMLSEALDTVCKSAYEVTLDMKILLSELQLHPERMLLNLKHTNGLIVAENVMMTLAPVLGRQTAHDVIHHAAEIAAREKRPVYDILWQDSRVNSCITQNELIAALDPANYLGQSIQVTDKAIARARIAANKLSSKIVTK